jgi:hypothetical protein
MLGQVPVSSSVKYMKEFGAKNRLASRRLVQILFQPAVGAERGGELPAS